MTLDRYVPERSRGIDSGHERRTLKAITASEQNDIKDLLLVGGPGARGGVRVASLSLKWH